MIDGENMDLKTDLIERFEYDLWANLQWLEAIPNMPDSTRAVQVIAHVAWAEEIWLHRLVPNWSHPGGELHELLTTVSAGWRELVSSSDLDHVVDYKNTKGVPNRRALGAIASHVVNHGTYHRGQLRGIAEAQGFEGFPETDLIGFYIVNDLHQ